MLLGMLLAGRSALGLSTLLSSAWLRATFSRPCLFDNPGFLAQSEKKRDHSVLLAAWFVWTEHIAHTLHGVRYRITEFEDVCILSPDKLLEAFLELRGFCVLERVQGLGGVSGPKPDRPDDKPAHKPVNGDEKVQTGDGVVISSEAQAAARVASLTLRAQGESDIRADKVQAAKEAIERGDYKNPDIVSEIAAKINKIL